MNRIALPLLLFSSAVLAACSTDIIDHSGNDNRIGVGNGADGGQMDASTACQVGVDYAPGFGALAIGQSSALRVQVQNVSSDPCTIVSVGVQPAGSAFSASVDVALPTTIAPGDRLDVAVTFAPTTVGPTSADLVVDFGGAPATFELTGIGAPEDIASNSSAEFVVQNTSAQDLFLVTAGWNCDPFDVGVRQGLAYPDVCEGPPWTPPTATTLRRLRPGESHSIVWDGREFVYISYDFDCTERGNPGFTITEIAGAKQPVATPDTFTVRVAFESTLPMDCRDEGDFVYCEPDMFGGGGGDFTTLARICPAMHQTAGTTFTLQSGMNTVVPITIAP